MLRDFLGVLQGLWVALAPLIAVGVAFKALRRPLGQSDELRRAFTTLEQDFEDLKRRVHGELGRISRLKRDGVTIPTTPLTTAEQPKRDSSPAPPLTRARLLARARQKGAFTYGEESDSARIDGGRRIDRPVDE